MNLQAALKDTLILKLILYKGTINNRIVVWQLDKNSGIACDLGLERILSWESSKYT